LKNAKDFAIICLKGRGENVKSREVIRRLEREGWEQVRHNPAVIGYSATLTKQDVSMFPIILAMFPSAL